MYLRNTVDGSHLLEVVTNNKSRTLIEAVYMKHTVTLVVDSSHYIYIFISNRAGKFYVTLFSNQKLVLNAWLSSSRSRKRVRFGISFAILASLSTSSTASAIVVVANNLQSKVAMALVSLSSAAAFFFKATRCWWQAPWKCLRLASLHFFLSKKNPVCLYRGARQDQRQDLSRPGEFQWFSLGPGQASLY